MHGEEEILAVTDCFMIYCVLMHEEEKILQIYIWNKMK